MTGRSVLLIDTEPRTHNHYIALAIADALQRHPSIKRVAIAHHGDAIPRFVDEEHDTLLAFGGSYIHTALLSRLCALAELSILWTTEDPYQLAENVRTSSAFDIVFTNDKASVSAYSGRGHHLPLAATHLFQSFPVPLNDHEYLYDLLFIGTAWPNRVRSLNTILSAFGADLKIKLALPWNEFIGRPRLVRQDLLTDWRCSNGDFARFANRSRLVLTLPRHFSASSEAQAVGSTPPPRLFETALAGGCQIMVSPETETAEYFEPDREIAICDSDEEAVEVIRALLAAPERRLEMARRARERAEREHLYDHRVARMFDVAEARQRSQRTSMPSDASRPTILMVSHNRAGYRSGGGVEVYLELLGNQLENHNVLFMFPAQRDGRDMIMIEGRGISRTFESRRIESETLSDPQVEAIFERVLYEEGVDLVHFHHLIHLPLSLPLIAKACGVPTIWHLHDFFLICDRFNLITFDRRFCDVVTRGQAQCDPCLLALNGLVSGTKARRNQFMAALVSSLDAVVASTQGGGEYIRGFFKELRPERIHVIELPTFEDKTKSDPKRNIGKPRDGSWLTVAIPGNFSENKGGAYIVELIKSCSDLNIRFNIYGRVDPDLNARVEGFDPARVTITNGYRRDQIISQMSGSDVSLHLSIWPETYMLSLSEAWQAGLVPVVTDLGAPGERVTEGVDGFKVPANDVAEALDRLKWLHFDPELLARMREAVARKTFVSADDHVAAVKALYGRLIAARPVTKTKIADQLSSQYCLSLLDVGIRLNSPRWTDLQNLWDGQSSRSGNTEVPIPKLVFRELPPDDAALQVVRSKRGQTRCHFDTLNVDSLPQSNNTAIVAFHDVALVGWLYDKRFPGNQRTYLRARGGSGTFHAMLHAEARDDVANSLSAPDARQLGFRGKLTVSDLPAGSYSADLLRVAGTSLLVNENVFSFTIQPASEIGFDQPSNWTAEPPSSAPLSYHHAAAFITAQNLRVIAGSPIGKDADMWWIDGHDLAVLSGSYFPTAVLLGMTGGIAYRTPLRTIASPKCELSGHFRIISQLRGVLPGLYSLAIEHITESGPSLQATGIKLFKCSDGDRHVWTSVLRQYARRSRWSMRAATESLLRARGGWSTS